MLSYQFSFYNSPVKSVKHINEPVLLQSFFDAIQKGIYKDAIEKIRSANDKEKLHLKAKLPYATLSGIFEPGTRQASTIKNHSGLISLDIDGKENPALNLEEFALQMKSDPFVLSFFVSPSGTGYKVIIPIEPAKHLESFAALEVYFKDKYNVVIDKACKDVCRPCFVSFDKNAYMNDKAKIFITDAKAPAVKKATVAAPEKKLADIEALCAAVDAQKLDITGTYVDYLKIGFAIADGLGESGRQYFHQICKHYYKYSYDEANKDFNECLKQRKAGITFSSLFYVAKQHGIIVTGKNDLATVKPESVQLHEPDDIYKFWTVIEKHNQDGTKIYKGFDIDKLEFVRLLFIKGFRRFDISNSFSFIRNQHNVIQEVQTNHIQDAFIKHLNSLPERINERITREELLRKTINQTEKLFSKNVLSYLNTDAKIIFNQDTKNESFAYYQNGFVKCVPGNYSFHPYKELDKSIWKERIIQRDFKKTDLKTFGNYEKFVRNVAGNDVSRIESLCSIIGYLLHDFTDGKMKAVVLTDSKISEDNEGRTGKTLFGKALKMVRNVFELSGKDFKVDDRFKYQGAQLSTQIIFLNDAKQKFDLETLYNDITEGITIEKKNQAPVSLKIKYIITTNRTIKTKGASSRGRVIEFEFSEHYSDKYTPEDEFQQWFFRDWDASEWCKFDNFMMLCTALYLEHGIIEANEVNLNKRKLIDQTCKQFYDFVQLGKVEPGKEFSLQKLTADFEANYPDYSFMGNKYPSRKLSSWLKLLPSYHEKFKDFNFEHTRRLSEETLYEFKIRTQ